MITFDDAEKQKLSPEDLEKGDMAANKTANVVFYLQ